MTSRGKSFRQRNRQNHCLHRAVSLPLDILHLQTRRVERKTAPLASTARVLVLLRTLQVPESVRLPLAAVRVGRSRRTFETRRHVPAALTLNPRPQKPLSFRLGPFNAVQYRSPQSRTAAFLGARAAGFRCPSTPPLLCPVSYGASASH